MVEMTLALPPKILHANGCSKHWGPKYTATRDYQDAMLIVGWDKRPAKPYRAISVTLNYFLRANAELADSHDNLVSWFKAGFDALQVAMPSKHGPRPMLGFVQNDRDIVAPVTINKAVDRDHPRLVVQIHPIA